ncbi:shieldin complex subunit 2 [Centropristis striata]|uniref:shieldin complex subunit 2 n=1 Tax=Centropristis striata TaxID=184440 RepID=UPI0027E01E55|nr:shieldin complex subunit 2 [Centropristis striata]
MCERKKIHVFLGAPPASSGPASGSGAGPQGAGWRHLELSWQDGHLRPAADEGRTEDQSTRFQIQDHETNTDSSPEADWTPRGREGRAPRAGDQEDLQRPAKGDPGQEAQCSASLREYLDRCFPLAQPGPEPEPEPEPGPGPPHCSKPQSPAVDPPLSSQTHFLATWTLSQALILRGRCGVQSATSPEKTPPPQAPPPQTPPPQTPPPQAPPPQTPPPQTPPQHTQTPPSVSSSTPELFSPAPPSLSPAASGELFSHPCPTPRAEHGGVVVEATADGVLCSQEAVQQQDSPPKSPDLKRARVSEDLGAEASSSTATATATTATDGLRGRTTLLSRCDRQGARYSVLVAVVHPCYLKEVKVRSGQAAGTSVPLASIVVTDQSCAEMKVVLWRRAAFWALTVSPGDVLLITGLQLNEDRWRGETVLQSTFSSKLLNLGQITAAASPPAPRHVNAGALSSLCSFLRERRPLLVSLNFRPPQDLNRLPYAALRALRVNTLVHALLRVTHKHISAAWRREAESRCRSALQLQAILTVEQPDGHQGALLLWGSAVDWLPRFSRDRAAVWDFHVLLVREGSTSDLLELHSTPWSSVRPLDPASRRAQDFLQPRLVRTGNSSSLELDLDTLLSQKYSGEVELRVQVVAFRFRNSPHSQNAPQPALDSSTPLDGILSALSGDVTYTGCGRCSAELDTDANGIYGPCYPCLPHTGLRPYYRPAVLTVRGRGCTQVCVQVPPVPLQKILEAPPDKLHRSSAPGSEVKHIQVAAERIQTLLAPPRKTFVITVRSHFLCDENSVPIDQDFTLLDLQLPG